MRKKNINGGFSEHCKQPKFMLTLPLVIENINTQAIRAREISEPPGESQVLNSAGASGLRLEPGISQYWWENSTGNPGKPNSCG